MLGATFHSADSASDPRSSRPPSPTCRPLSPPCQRCRMRTGAGVVAARPARAYVFAPPPLCHKLRRVGSFLLERRAGLELPRDPRQLALQNSLHQLGKAGAVGREAQELPHRAVAQQVEGARLDRTKSAREHGDR